MSLVRLEAAVAALTVELDRYGDTALSAQEKEEILEVIRALPTQAGWTSRDARKFVSEWLWSSTDRTTSGQPWQPEYIDDVVAMVVAASVALQGAGDAGEPDYEAAAKVLMDWCEQVYDEPVDATYDECVRAIVNAALRRP